MCPISILLERPADPTRDEWTRNLLKNSPQLDSTKVQRFVQLMSDAVRDWEVTSFQDLVLSVSLPDKNDRHVLAAAVKANADAIITLNLKHFPESSLTPHGVEALHPDDFVLDLVDLNAHQVLEAARLCWQRRRKPPSGPWEADFSCQAGGKHQPDFPELANRLLYRRVRTSRSGSGRLR